MRTASWHRDSNTSDSHLFCQYFLLLHFSLHVTCRNKHSDCFTSTRTNKHKYGPSDFSFPQRPFKQFKTYTWRPQPEEFADHTLPRNKIKSISRKSKSRFFKFRQCLSNCRSLSWSNATATAPASQAGHLYWRQTLNSSSGKQRSTPWSTLRQSALNTNVSLVPTLRRKREKSRWATPIYGQR